jgi:L-arabinose isomerase
LKKYPAISDKLTGEAQLGLAILTIGLTKLGVLKQMRDKGTEILTNINATLNQYREFYKAKTEQMRNQQAQAEQSGNARAEQYG